MALDNLTQSTPIVNAKGQPTLEFMIKWQQLKTAAGSIAPLATAAEVSAVLDVLTSTPGDMLVRGPTLWQELPIGSAGEILGVASGLPAWESSSGVIDGLGGGTNGAVLLRGASAWAGVSAGAANEVLASGTPSVWKTLSALLDAVMGSTQGDILYRGASVWAALGPGTAGQALISGGAGANPSWGSGGGGGGGGLYSGVMSSLPTSFSTGLTSWVNQNSSFIFNGPTGVSMTSPGTISGNVVVLYGPAPTAPYSVTALLALTGNSTAYDKMGLCFYDGSSKIQTFGSFIGQGKLGVTNWNAYNSYAGDVVGSGVNWFQQVIWLKLQNDGTNIYFKYSFDGQTFETLYTTTIAGGFLNALGYNNVGLFMSDLTNGATVTVLSWVA